MIKHDFRIPVMITGIKIIKGVLAIKTESPWCPCSDVVIPLTNPIKDYDYLKTKIGKYIYPLVHTIDNIGGQTTVCCYITKIKTT